MKKIFTCICAALLVGCSGGSDKITIAVYGDSITAAEPGLTKSFASELGVALNANVKDYSRGGGSVRDYKEVDNSADLIIIRYAGADALHYGSSTEAVNTFRTSLLALISTANKPVVLTGTITLAPYEQLLDYNYPFNAYTQKQKDLTVYHKEVQSIATSLGIPFVDIRKVPFYGREDLRDEVHPNQGYSTRLSNYIISEIIHLI